MAEEIGIALTLSGLKEFLKGLEDSQTNVKNVQKLLKEVVTDLDLFESKLKIGDTSKNLSKTTTELDRLDAEVISVQKNLELMAGELIKKFTESSVVVNKITQESGEAAEATKSLTSSLASATQIELISESFKELYKSLHSLGGLDIAPLAKILDDVGASFVSFHEKFKEHDSIDFGLTSNLKNITETLEAFSKTISFFGRSTTIAKFGEVVDSIVTSLNGLASRLNVTEFLGKIIPYKKALEDLSQTIGGLVKLNNSGVLARALGVELEKQRQATIELRDSKRDEKEAINKLNKAQKEEAKLRQEQIELIREQKRVNDQYFYDTLSQSTNILDRWIANLRKSNEELTSTGQILKALAPQLRVKLEVIGIKIATRTITALTVGPIKLLIGSVRLLSKLSLSSITAAFRGLYAVVIKFGNSIKNIVSKVISFGKAIGSLGINKLVSIFKSIISVIQRFISTLTNIISKIFSLKAIMSVISAPFIALAKAIELVVTSFSKLFNILTLGVFKNTKVETDKTKQGISSVSQELNDLEKELNDSSRASDNFTQNMHEVDNALDGVNNSTRQTNDSFKLSVKSIAAMSVSVVALQKALQLVGFAFQRVRFFLSNSIRSAVEAASEYELLTLSMTALTKLEFKELGLLDVKSDLDAATDSANSLKTALTNATDINLGKFISAQNAVPTNLNPQTARLTALENTNLKVNIDTSTLPNAQQQVDAVSNRVQDLLRWVRVLAIQSPFEESDVAEIFKYGLALGFTSDQMQDLTQNVVDFGAGTGASADQMKSIIRALGQMKNNSFLAKEELNQLSEAGFRNPLQALVDAIPGIEDSTDALQAISDKAIDGEAAVAIFSRRMQADFAGSAIQATQTLSGLISTIESLRKNLLREFTTPLFDFAKPIIASFTGVEQISSLLERANALGQVFADKIKNALVTVTEYFGAFSAVLSVLPDAITPNIKQLAKFAATMAGIITVALAAVAAVSALSLVFTLVANPIGLLTISILGLQQVVRVMSIRFADEFSAMRSAFNSFWTTIKPGLENVIKIFVSVLNRIASILSSFITTIFTYGHNLGVSFANGIVSAIKSVVNAVISLVGAIKTLLEAHSPPKAYPNIDDDGTAAADAYIGGFSKADFSLIEDFGSTIEDIVSGFELAPGQSIDTNDIQRDFEELLSAFNDGADQTEAIAHFYSELNKEMGETGDTVNIVASEYIKLAQEQATLNQVTEDYNKNLKVANAELDKLDREETSAGLQSDLESINNQLKNRFLTQQQIDALELKRKQTVAQLNKLDVEAQQDAVDQQQERVDLIKARLGLEKKDAGTNAVTSDTSSLDKLGKEKVKKVKEEVGDLTEGLSDAFSEAVDLSDALDDIELPELNFGEIFADAKKNALGKIQELKDKFSELGITASTAKVAVGGLLGLLILPKFVTGISALANGLKALVAIIAPFVGVGTGLALAIGGIGLALVLFADKITPELLTNLSTGFNTFTTSLGNFFTAYKEGLSGTDGTAFTSFSEFLNSLGTMDMATLAANLGASFSQIRETVTTGITNLSNSVIAKLRELFITPFVNAFKLNDEFEEFTFDDRTLAQRILDGVLAVLTKVGTTVITTFTNFAKTYIIEPFNEGFNSITESDLVSGFVLLYGQILAGLASIYEPITEAITGYIKQFIDLDKIRDAFKESIQAPFKDAVENLTLENINATLTEKITAGINAALENVEIDLSSIFSVDLPILNDIRDRFVEFTEGLPTNLLQPFVYLWETFIKNIQESELGSKLIDFGAAFYEFATNVGLVVGALAGFVALIAGSIFVELPNILGAVIDVFTGVLNIVNAVVSLFKGDFVGAVQQLNDGLAKIVDAIFSLFASLQAIIFNITAVFLRLAGFDTTEAEEKIGNFIETVRNFREIVVKNLSETIELIIEKVTNIKDSIITLVNTISENFSKIFTTFEDGITVFNLEPLTNIVDAFVEVKDKFLDLYSALAEKVLVNPLVAILDSVLKFLQVPEDIRSTITSIAEVFATALFANPFATITAGLTAIPDLIDQVTSKFDGAKEFFDNLTLPNPLSRWNNKDDGEADKVVDDLNTSIENASKNSDVTLEPNVKVNTEGLNETGKEVVAGVAQGITDNQATLDDANDAAAESTVPRWKKWFGINSPSTVMRDEVGTPIAEGIIEGLNTTLEADTTSEEAGKSYGQKILDGVKSVISEFDFSSALFGGQTTETATAGASSVLSIDPALVETFIASFTTAFSTVITALTDFTTEYQEINAEFIETLTKALNDFSEATIELVQDTFIAIVNLLVLFIADVIRLLNDMINKAEQALTRFTTVMKQAAKDGIAAFLKELDDFGEDVQGKIEDQLDGILEGEDGIKAFMNDWGAKVASAMISGINTGLENNKEKVKKKLDSIFNEWIGAILKSMGIESPSKVTRDKIGKPLMDGIGVGIEQGALNVNKTIAKTANTIKDTLTNKFNTATSKLSIPISVKYKGLKSQLPDLSQNVALNRQGISSDIAAMQLLSGANVIHNNSSYTLNMTVNERIAPKVNRHFNTMQNLRV